MAAWLGAREDRRRREGRPREPCERAQGSSYALAVASDPATGDQASSDHHRSMSRARSRARRSGSVRVDRVTRELYSTDASPYRILPDRGPASRAHRRSARRGRGVPRARHLDHAARRGDVLHRTVRRRGSAVDCSLLDAIEWIDTDRRIARVQPGARWWTLNEQAAKVGLHFGPDPATRRQCTVGGMTATNSGGTHSIVYGAAVDHVHALDVILADGRTARIDANGGLPVRHRSAARRRTRTGDAAARPGLLDARAPRRRLPARASLHRSPMPRSSSRVPKATLALITAVEVTLDDLPTARVLAVIAFDDLHAAIAAVPGARRDGPVRGRGRVEVDDRHRARRCRSTRVRSPHRSGRRRAALRRVPRFESPDEAESGFARMDRVLDGVRAASGRATVSSIRPRSCGCGRCARPASARCRTSPGVRTCRRRSSRTPSSPSTGSRRTSVRSTSSSRAHEMEVVWYGHAATGLVHVRPFLDLSNGSDLQRLEGLMEAVTDLVRDWGGDHSGEHGEGSRARTGTSGSSAPSCTRELREIKAAFDPTNLLNPGKVVDGPRTTDNLRYGTSYERKPRRVTSIAFDDYDGFEPFAERCYGSGVLPEEGRRDVSAGGGDRARGALDPCAREPAARRRRRRARRSTTSARTKRTRSWTPASAARRARRSVRRASTSRARRSWWLDADAPTERRDAAATRDREPAGRSRRLGSPVAPARERDAAIEDASSARSVSRERERCRRSRRSRSTVAHADDERRAAALSRLLHDLPGPRDRSRGRAADPGPRLAPAGCCGRVMLSEGYIEKARARREQRGAMRCGPRRDRSSSRSRPACRRSTDDWQHLIGDVSDIAERCALAEIGGRRTT